MVEDAQLMAVVGTLCLISAVESAVWGNGVDDYDADDRNWDESAERDAAEDAEAEDFFDSVR